MRGKAIDFSFGVVEDRITPAYAGKSIYHVRQRLPTKDHPRLCGEKGGLDTKHTAVIGSPPPMRGKGFKFPFVGIRSGITPAYAGKSKTIAGEAFKGEDHPRLCGEKLMCQDITRSQTGSPPPMRGKGSSKFWRRTQRWITPAYAGKSAAVRHYAVAPQDHPRLCGEKRLARP